MHLGRECRRAAPRPKRTSSRPAHTISTQVGSASRCQSTVSAVRPAQAFPIQSSSHAVAPHHSWSTKIAMSAGSSDTVAMASENGCGLPDKATWGSRASPNMDHYWRHRHLRGTSGKEFGHSLWCKRQTFHSLTPCRTWRHVFVLDPAISSYTKQKSRTCRMSDWVEERNTMKALRKELSLWFEW